MGRSTASAAIMLVVCALGISISSPAAPLSFVTFEIPGTALGHLDINNAGQIVGSFDDSGSGYKYHGFLRAPSGTLTTLNVPNAISTTATGINDAGRVVGDFADVGFRHHGYVRTSGGSFITFDPPGSTNVYRYGTSTTALVRHKGQHLSRGIVRALERRQDRHANSLIDQVDALAARTQALLDEVFPEQRQNGQKVQARDVAAVVREVRETLRLTAQLTGQLKVDGTTLNVGIGILNSPEWGQIAAAMTGALRDEPSARARVAEALARLANGTTAATVSNGRV